MENDPKTVSVDPTIPGDDYTIDKYLSIALPTIYVPGYDLFERPEKTNREFTQEDYKNYDNDVFQKAADLLAEAFRRHAPLKGEECVLTVSKIKRVPEKFGKKEGIFQEFDFVDLIPQYNCSVYLLHKAQTLYIPIYGTRKPIDFIKDAQCTPEPFPYGFIHRGFFEVAYQLVDKVKRWVKKYDAYYRPSDGDASQYRVVIGGHSLGGATAIILYLLLKTKYPQISFYCVTFGAPLCLTYNFQNILNVEKEVLNVINYKDPIPMVTSKFGPGSSMSGFQQLSVYRHDSLKIKWKGLRNYVHGYYDYRAFGSYILINRENPKVITQLENNRGNVELPSGTECSLKNIGEHGVAFYIKALNRYTLSIINKKRKVNNRRSVYASMCITVSKQEMEFNKTENKEGRPRTFSQDINNDQNYNFEEIIEIKKEEKEQEKRKFLSCMKFSDHTVVEPSPTNSLHRTNYQNKNQRMMQEVIHYRNQQYTQNEPGKRSRSNLYAFTISKKQKPNFNEQNSYSNNNKSNNNNNNVNTINNTSMIQESDIVLPPMNNDILKDIDLTMKSFRDSNKSPSSFKNSTKSSNTFRDSNNTPNSIKQSNSPYDSINQSNDNENIVENNRDLEHANINTIDTIHNNKTNEISNNSESNEKKKSNPNDGIPKNIIKQNSLEPPCIVQLPSFIESPKSIEIPNINRIYNTEELPVLPEIPNMDRKINSIEIPVLPEIPNMDRKINSIEIPVLPEIPNMDRKINSIEIPVLPEIPNMDRKINSIEIPNEIKLPNRIEINNNNNIKPPILIESPDSTKISTFTSQNSTIISNQNNINMDSN
ncbi:hypothetical protein WA158_006676 [Blastocystis sp. Blastoise]